MPRVLVGVVNEMVRIVVASIGIYSVDVNLNRARARCGDCIPRIGRMQSFAETIYKKFVPSASASAASMAACASSSISAMCALSVI